MSDFDRGSAALTPKQRAHLRGEADIDENTSHERVTRSRIRDRLRASLLDIALMHDTLDAKDVKTAFEDPEFGPENHDEIIHMFNQASNIFALLFDGLSRASNRNHIEVPGNQPGPEMIEMFEHYVESGLADMYRGRGLSVNSVNVDISIELQGDISDLAEKDYSELTKHELDELLSTQEITLEEYKEGLEQILETRDEFDLTPSTPSSDDSAGSEEQE